MTTATKNFVATATEIAALVEGVFQAETAGTTGKLTYLRSLVATTQTSMNGKPKRKAAGKRPLKIKESEIEPQLAALNSVHENFYKEVVAVARKYAGDDPLELNRRTNFARSSVSMARSFIKAGYDLGCLNVQTLTKASLEVKRAKPAITAKRAESAVVRRATQFRESIVQLAQLDKGAALSALKALLGALTAQLDELGMIQPVKDSAESILSGRPLKVEGRIFLPAVVNGRPS